jgi:class 3 adenylate cyclase
MDVMAAYDPRTMEGRSAIERETRTTMRRLQHELRTPLGQILGYGEMLEEDLRDRRLVELLPDLARIRSAANTLLAVIEGVLLANDEPSLPASSIPSGSVPASDGSVPTRNQRRGRILVVDDDATNRELLCRRLGREGHAVVEAAGGRAALALIEAEPFDLVLLDLMMPEMDGIETLASLRRARSLSELPVIMVTSRSATDDVVAALRHGANDYLTKPLEFRVVMARVQTQLALRKAARDVEALAQQLEIRNAFLRRTFGRYLSDEVVASLLERDDGLEITGERRRVSILMADVRGFTALTERLEPRDVVTVLNSYLSAMSNVIDAYDGSIDEFIGDGILALFGAFEVRDDDAQRAVACAIAMQREIQAVNDRNQDRKLPAIAMGVGVATGEVVVGNVGSEKRSKHTAIGSAVNLAARIESFTSGGEILISPNTFADVEGVVDVALEREIEPKGFDGVILVRRVSTIRGAHAISIT